MAPSRAERVAREARDQAICTIASSCRPDERAELTRALRAAGALTPALLLRSLLGGERTLFAQALAELSGLPLPRVAAFILEPQGEGFAALARRAGLKAGVLLAFRAALAAIKAQAAEPGDSLKLPLVQKVIDACERARRSGARQGSGAAVALRRRSGKGGSGTLRPRGGGFDFSRSAPAAPGIFAGQRRSSITRRNCSPTSHDLRPARRCSSLTRRPANSGEDKAPRVELPPELVARLDDAA